MSERVNIEQAREVANKPIAPLEQVWRDMLNEMADEIERLRATVERLEMGIHDATSGFMSDQSEAYEILMKAYLGGNNGNE